MDAVAKAIQRGRHRREVMPEANRNRTGGGKLIIT